MSKRTVEDRFLEKVHKTATCWEWIGAKTNGYGLLRIAGKRVASHRVSYELSNGPIPEGMRIDHICHNKSCVNPSHLRLATAKENAENRCGPRAKSLSGIRGVVWSKRARKWQVQVGHGGVNHYVGLFDSLTGAETAAVAKRNELFTHNDLDRAA